MEFRRVILIFVLTLSAVVLLGLGALAAYHFTGGMGREEAASATDMETEEEEQSAASPVSFEPAPAAEESAAAEASTEPEPEPEPEPEEPEIVEEPEEIDPYAEVEEDFFIRRAPAADPDVVTMAFAGDILFDKSYAIQARMPAENGIASVVGSSLLEEMNRVDLMVINNEFPYTDRGAPQADKAFTFHAHPRTVRQLKDMGADLVSLANNHTFDYGEEGFLDTLDTLDRAGVPRVGAGRDIDEASHPMYFLVDGMKIGVIAATQIERHASPNTRGATETLPGVFRCLDDTKLCEKVREARAECDFLIVFIHWGTENETQPDWLQVQQAPEIAAAGADLIIGGHSHCLQPLGYSGDVPVVYSLGNFLFNSKTLDTVLIECEIERVDPAQDGDEPIPPGSRAKLKSLRFMPCIQSGCSVRFAEGAEADRILQFMRGISKGVAIDEEGYFTKE
ncbi:MAG: CapA family protein [Lachnospiraceae bacterium]|nr:CapA family protein [Lachnospiraceae bacterium]